MATAGDPEPTPNPDALKFPLDRPVGETFSFRDADAAAGHPFAREVFATGRVTSVFGTADFVTVNRTPGADWEPIVAAVRRAAAEHL